MEKKKLGLKKTALFFLPETEKKSEKRLFWLVKTKKSLLSMQGRLWLGAEQFFESVETATQNYSAILSGIFSKNPVAQLVGVPGEGFGRFRVLSRSDYSKS